jgi:Flp pilus assembly protein TadG
MRTATRCNLKRQTGQATIELAFSLLLLISIILGMYDCALAFQEYIQVVSAADAAVTYASKGQAQAINYDEIRNAGRAESGGTVCGGGNNLVFTIHDRVNDGYGGQRVTIDVSCNLALAGGMIALPSGLDHVVVQASATRRIMP